MPSAKSKPWSFYWLCNHCDSPREYLVNELKDQEVVWARCGRCSSLLRVNDEHRALRSKPGSKV